MRWWPYRHSCKSCLRRCWRPILLHCRRAVSRCARSPLILWPPWAGFRGRFCPSHYSAGSSRFMPRCPFTVTAWHAWPLWQIAKRRCCCPPLRAHTPMPRGWGFLRVFLPQHVFTAPQVDTGGLYKQRPVAVGDWPFLMGQAGAQCVRILARKRAIDWLCSWHTRDSVTPSTAAISLRFISCS